MNSPRADLGEQPPLSRIPRGYIPTEEERRAFRECNSESFWFRSFPLSVLSMLATHTLIRRGILTTGTRFGAFPKVAVAGVFGFVAGKFSYVNQCQEKFLRLENSPIADIFRKEPRPPAQFPQRTDHAEIAPPQQTFTPVGAEPPSSVYSSKYESSAAEVPFSASMSESSPTGIGDNVLLEPEPIPEETFKQKPVTYDELRDQNRDSYHKAGLVSSRPPVPEKKPWKEAKKNKYGDVWEE